MALPVPDPNAPFVLASCHISGVAGTRGNLVTHSLNESSLSGVVSAFVHGWLGPPLSGVRITRSGLPASGAGKLIWLPSASYLAVSPALPRKYTRDVGVFGCR